MKTRSMMNSMFTYSFACIACVMATASYAADPYIESDGTAFVNSGVMPAADLRIEVDYALTTIANDTKLFGAYTGSGQNAEFYVNSTGGFSFHVGQGWVGGTYLVMPDLNRHTVVFDIPAGMVHHLTGSVTNKTASMKSTPGLSSTGTVPIGLFGRISNANGLAKDGNSATMRIYGAKFYKGGTLVKRLVPCVKGNVAGFRDSVGGEFVTAELSSGLTAGGDVERILDDGFIELYGNDGTAGGHYFDTDYTAGPNTRIEVDYAFTENNAGSGDWNIITSDYNSNASMFSLYFLKSNGKLCACLGTGKWKNTGIDVPTATRGVRRKAILDSPNKAVTIMTSGYVNYANTNDQFTAAETMANTLKIGSTAGTGGNYAPIRIYGLKIYESGALVREYVPYVKNGAPGLKYGDTFVKVSWNAANGAAGIPKAGGDIAVSSDSDRDAYVLFSGAQRVDTGYTPNGKTKLVVDFGFANGYNKPQQELFDAGGSGLFCRLYTQNGGGTDAKYSWLFNKTWGVLHSGIAVDHQRRLLTIDSPNNQTRLAPGATDDSTYNGDSTLAGWNRDATSPKTLVFGSLAVADANNGYMYAKARLYRLTIYNDGTKVREYVPCVVNGVAGLYDLANPDSEPLTADGLTVSGRGHEGAEEWISAPQSVNLRRSPGETTLKAFAVGAQSYTWKKNGAEIDGGTNGELTVEWAKGGNTDTYSVTAVYDVFGEEVAGSPVEYTVENIPVGMVITIR